jgi:hypothetical protein
MEILKKFRSAMRELLRLPKLQENLRRKNMAIDVESDSATLCVCQNVQQILVPLVARLNQKMPKEGDGRRFFAFVMPEHDEVDGLPEIRLALAHLNDLEMKAKVFYMTKRSNCTCYREGAPDEQEREDLSLLAIGLRTFDFTIPVQKSAEGLVFFGPWRKDAPACQTDDINVVLESLHDRLFSDHYTSLFPNQAFVTLPELKAIMSCVAHAPPMRQNLKDSRTSHL